MKKLRNVLLMVVMVMCMVVSMQAKAKPSETKSEDTKVKFTVVGDFILKPDGTLWAMGINKNGRLSKDVAEDMISRPIQIMKDVAFIGGKGYAEDEEHFREAYILKKDGTLYLLGKELEEIMEQVSFVSDDFIVDKKGKVYAWGEAQNDVQLQKDLGITIEENVTGVFSHKPTLVKGLSNVKQIAYETDWTPTGRSILGSGNGTVLILKKDGTLEGKYNICLTEGKTVTNGNQIKPIMKDVKSIECVGAVNMVIKKDNSLWAWGSTIYGSFGGGIDQTLPEPTKILDDVKTMYASFLNNFALTNKGDIYAWGFNQIASFSDLEGRFYKFPNGNYTDLLGVNGFYFVALNKDGTVWMYVLDPASEITESYDEQGNYVENSDKSIGAFGTDKANTHLGGYDFKSAYSFEGAVAIGVGNTDSAFATYALDKEGRVWAWGTKFLIMNADGTEGKSTRRPFVIIDNQ